MLQHNLAVADEAIEGEVIGAVVQDTAPIYLRATIQFVVPAVEVTSNHNHINRQLSVIDSQQKEIVRLNKLLTKKMVVDTDFATTKEAAAFVRYDPSFLTKRQGKVFKLDQHFFKPKGESGIRWSLDALTKWVKSDENNDKNITPKLANLLERS